MSRRRAIEVAGLSHGVPIPNAAVVGNLLASGGVSGLDRATGELPPALEDQVANLFANVEVILAAADATLDDVVKFTFFVLDRAARATIDPHWVRLFPDPATRPARHTLGQQLPEPMLVQCEFIAVMP